QFLARGPGGPGRRRAVGRQDLYVLRVPKGRGDGGGGRGGGDDRQPPGRRRPHRPAERIAATGPQQEDAENHGDDQQTGAAKGGAARRAAEGTVGGRVPRRHGSTGCDAAITAAGRPSDPRSGHGADDRGVGATGGRREGRTRWRRAIPTARSGPGSSASPRAGTARVSPAPWVLTPSTRTARSRGSLALGRRVPSPAACPP